MKKYQKLFEPIQIGKVRVKNRIAMSPMGAIGYSDPRGAFNQRSQDYYVERAKNSVGLIFTGFCTVDRGIEGFPSNFLPCPTYDPLAFIFEASQMNERIHAHGGRIFLQLTGGLGRSEILSFVDKYIAPSEQENRFNPNIIHREITKEEINNILDKFVESAVIAKKSGFDGIEVHAVHEGYLLDQFAISFYNHRTDEYGGSLENRLRISTEIVKRVKAACGDDFPVSLRYSVRSYMKGLRQGALPGEDYEEVGKTLEEGIEAAKILSAAGYDALNVDTGTYDSWYWNHPPMYFEDGMYCRDAEALRKEVDIPIIVAGRMDDPDLAMKELGKSCDMVSYGRPLLADPELAEKIRTGRIDEIRPCLSCQEGCVGRISHAPVCCAVNPSCGREEIYGLTPALTKKKVLVIGGGVAGLETAQVCTLRGHEVILCEKSGALGGNLIPGGVPDFKRNDGKLIQYYTHQMELLGVDVRLNTTVTAEDIDAYKVDVIVCATGAAPRILTLPGPKELITASDALLGKAPVGEEICIIGAGLVGCETGLWLAKQGKKVHIIDVVDELFTGAAALPHPNEYMIIDLLNYYKIDIHTGTSAIASNDVGIEVKTGEEAYTIPADTIITAVGYISDSSLYDSLKELDNPYIYNVGDSAEVHNIMYAIWNAYEIARNL